LLIVSVLYYIVLMMSTGYFGYIGKSAKFLQ